MFCESSVQDLLYIEPWTIQPGDGSYFFFFAIFKKQKKGGGHCDLRAWKTRCMTEGLFGGFLKIHILRLTLDRWGETGNRAAAAAAVVVCVLAQTL